MTVTARELARLIGRPEPTDEQCAVIESAIEPALVIAGAGSGKTETIAARVVYLVANGLTDPAGVLGLTFTRKAAAELSERIRSRLRTLAGTAGRSELAPPATGADPLIGTYHAFAGRLIDEFGPLAGIEPAARVLTQTACWQLARDIVGRWDRDLDTDHTPDQVTQDVLAISSALGDHLVTPDALDDELARILDVLAAAPPSKAQRSPVHHGIAAAMGSLTDRRSLLPLVRAYWQAKRELRVVDFADQMQLAARIVTDAPSVGATLRARYGVVLLDEYQDTGHAQRVILRGLFGDASGHCVTAVGDPMQSIYSWRGASASNLVRFPADFSRSDGTPAVTRPLLVSFRNDHAVLAVANAVSAQVRGGRLAVGDLRPAAGAGAGAVTSALLTTVAAENGWLADTLTGMRRAYPGVPTMAVLVRRRASMAGIAAALRERGLDVEVVGVGGLVDEPEVADVIAMLRMVVDHQSGSAAVRILTGARWRLGIADLAALARRARALRAGGTPGAATGRGAAAVMDNPALAAIRAALADAVGGEDVDEAGLVDALADPGDRAAYSEWGWRRVSMLQGELRRLRARLTAPVAEVVSAVERALGLDVEVLLTPDGRAHLDEFESVVADVAATGAGPVELLDYLATAGVREDGLPPGVSPSPPGRVLVLTVHSAKGLEWDIVAVPHLSEGVFPNGTARSWLGDAAYLPPALRGDRADLPGLDLPPGADQKELAAVLAQHRAAWREVQLEEERRLFYVAVTRARHRLVLSAHHWGSTRTTPTGPGAFFAELADGPGALLGDIAEWAEAPEAGSSNPMLDDPITGDWPIDPLGDRRPALSAGADLVRAAERRDRDADGAGPAPVRDPEGWLRDIDLLLAERAAAAGGGRTVAVPLPPSLSVSELVTMADDPQRLARALRRPVPQMPAPQARRGTAFHAWLERRFGGDALLDLAELPGAHDEDAAPDDRLDELVSAFLASEWATRTPIAVEVPFVTQIAGLTVRGRMDAVYAEPDEGALVVDWKTGAVPTGERARSAAVQLTAYRLAWSRLRDVPLDRVRAVFHYVGAGRTVAPHDLMDADGLARLIADSTQQPTRPTG